MTIPSKALPKTITVTVPIKFEQKGGRKIVLSPTPHARPSPRHENSLIKALARAYRWRQAIEDGRYSSITELAAAEGINQSYVCRILRLTLLAPTIVHAILDGTQPRTLQLDDLIKPHSTEWNVQIRVILNMGVQPQRTPSGKTQSRR
jgi:hypothetical protein